MEKKFYLTSKLPPYIFAKIYDLKQQAIANGKEIIDFGMGNPDSPPPKKIMEELSKLALDPTLYGYSVTGGIDFLKKAIVKFYHRRFNVNLDYKTQAIVTIGAKEGIASLATAICDTENYICVPSPSYPIHTFGFVIAKSSVKHIPAISADDFLKNFKKFVESQTKKPQAVIVSYPCNPTTQIASLEFYQELVDFCRHHQIYIISDIAYGELYFSKADKPNSILEIKGASDIAIEFYSVSKSYSLAGTRVGFAVGNVDLISALYKIKSYLDYGSFTALQMIAGLALDEAYDDYLENLRQLYKNRGEFFVKTFANELAWHIDKPKASMFCWAQLPSQFKEMSSFDFCEKMILEAGVAISPGSSFGENGEGFVRFSMIRNEQEIVKASDKLKQVFSFKI